jgi:hypothetical protein
MGNVTEWLMLDLTPSQKRAARKRWLADVLPYAGQPDAIGRAMAAYREERSAR